jgi:lipopolysaccharide biosynthesis glycosyltransferase
MAPRSARYDPAVSDPLHLVVATDVGFAVPTAVALRSALATTGPARVQVTVLHDQVPDDVRQRIDESLPAGSLPVRWVAADLAPLGPLPSYHLPKATWFRLLAVDVVPPGVERVVYLDVDVLVRRSLEPLWEVDLARRPLGAVRSVNYPSIGTWGAFDHWRRHGVDPRLPFFNAGMLVVDVEAWAAAGTTAQIMDLMASGDIHGGDQQALNVALAGRWTELDPIWNQQTPLLDDRRGGHLLYDDHTIDQARADPAVIHFLDRPKPWHVDSTHPARQEWRDEAGRTAFAPIQLERTPQTEKVRRRLKRAASAIVRGR